VAVEAEHGLIQLVHRADLAEEAAVIMAFLVVVDRQAKEILAVAVTE